MAELKTKKNEGNVKQFIESIEDEKKRQDAFKIMEIMQNATNSEASMWGESIVGFGSYHYKSQSGREGNWFLAGFSPRKQNLTLYIMAGFDNYDTLMGKLGKFKTGKSCLYIKKLDDVDTDVLKQLVQQSVDHMQKSNAE